VLHAARGKCRTKKSPYGHHRTTLSGCIFATKARIDNRKRSPYCGDMWRTYSCLTSFFSNCRYMPYSCEDIARQSCGMVPRWRFLATFLGPAFAASRVQHLSDLHSKFAIGPHHVSKYGRHPTCGR